MVALVGMVLLTRSPASGYVTRPVSACSRPRRAGRAVADVEAPLHLCAAWQTAEALAVKSLVQAGWLLV
jgi:hypothetical protein